MAMKQLSVLFGGRVQATYLLDLPRIVIGRGVAANISLEDNPFVSRQHAAISFEGATHVLQDLGGPNGTFIGEKRIRLHPLKSGERILLGKHSLRYEDATPEAESLKELMEAAEAARAPSPEPLAFEEVSDEEVWQEALTQPGASAPVKPAAPTKSFPLDPNAFSDASTTVAASKQELNEMVRRMTLKTGPHLSVPREGGIDLVPVDLVPFDIGWTRACHFQLPGSKWFGKKAVRLEVQHGAWYLVSLSPSWTPVEVNGTRIKQKIKLVGDARINISGRLIRFSPGEDD